MHQLNRIRSLINRIRSLASFTNGYSKALKIVFSIHANINKIQEGIYQGKKISFRGIDERALYEVLLNQEYSFLINYLKNKEKPTVLDVGAHIGTFGIWLKNLKPDAQILSVEPDPNTFEIAILNASEYQTKAGTWEVLQLAAGRINGELLYLLDIGNSMSHRIDHSGNIEVESINFGSLIEKITLGKEVVDLVKIDIEGSEEDFLLSNPSVLKKVNALIVELHPYLCDTDKIRKTLEENFSHISEITNRISSKPLLFCLKDPNT